MRILEVLFIVHILIDGFVIWFLIKNKKKPKIKKSNVRKKYKELLNEKIDINNMRNEPLSKGANIVEPDNT